MRVFAAVCLGIALPSAATAQTQVTSLDSAGLGAAVAARIAEERQDSTSTLVIDTTGNRWNAFVRQALLRRAPRRLPMLGDSAAHYAPHFSVISVVPTGAVVDITVRREGCYSQTARAFSEVHWAFQKSDAGWRPTVPPHDQVITGHGLCLPYQGSRAR